MKKEIEVLNSTKTISITPLALGKYPELLKRIKKLPEHLSKLGDLSEESILASLPELIAESYEDVSSVLEVATSLKKEEIAELNLNEAVDVVVALIEVNQYQAIYAKIKKALSRPKLDKAEK
jgi:CRP-like cAMP-binding protein